MQKHIVIFSHGFGTRSDDYGMFPPIVAGLPEVETMLFDYCLVDDEAHTLTIRPFGEQVEVLRKVIAKTREENPDAIIDIIAHSQGCIIAALLCPHGIRKAVFTSPRDNLGYEDTVNRFKKRPGTIINFDGVSTLVRSDGSQTFVPAQYWKDRDTTDLMTAYKKFSEVTDLTMITPNQDSMHQAGNFPGLKVIKLDGDHSFSGKDMPLLIEKIREIIL